MSPYPADDLRRLAGRAEPAWLWDPDRHRIVWSNRSGLAFWGDATLIDLIERRFDPDLATMRAIAGLVADLAAGEVANRTLVFHPRGGERALRAACRTRPLDDGRTGLLVVAAAPEPEAAGDDARSGLLEIVAEALPLAVAVFDAHSSLVYANAACRDLVAEGPEADDVLAGWLGDGDLASELAGRALALGSVSEIVTLRTRFGARAQRVDLTRIAAPVHGRSALLACFVDVEDRRRIERARDRRVEELEAALVAAADVSFALDERLRITAISGAVRELFATDPDGLTGRPFLDAIRELGLEPDSGAARRIAAFEPVRGSPARLRTDAGDSLTVLTAVPISDPQGRTLGTRGAITRVTAALEPAGNEYGDIVVKDAPAEASARGDDNATFSAIARAVAAHADSTAGGDVRSGEGGDRASALRVVGGVEHADRKRPPRPIDLAAEPRHIAADDVEGLDQPALVHRAFDVVALNRRLAAMLGFSDRLPGGANLLNIFPDERARLFSLQSRIDDGETLQPGEIGIIPLRATTASREPKLLLAHIERVTLDGETAVLMRFEDPAASERGEEGVEAPPASPAAAAEAAAGEVELRAILNSAADGIVTLDAEGRIATFNATAETIFGQNATDVVGRKLASLLETESGRIVDAYLQSVSDGKLSSLHREGREVVGQRKDGATVPLFLTIGPVKLDGAPRFCAVIRDITRWKQAVSELERAKDLAERASSKKSDFLARISHELRTPLNAIIGFSEVMSEERFGPIANDRYKGYLTDIRASGEHLLSLINDLLDLSKIEAGKLELNFESVDLGALIQQCISLMQPQATRERVIIRTSLPDQLPAVVADSRSVRQILLNILSNAIKFTPPGGQVILSALLDDAGRVQVRVRDTGEGMSADELAKAMEPFRQIDAAMRTSPLAGTGLGLPLTKALTEANRAEFRIESTPQAGTLVQIIFPSERVLAG